MNEVVIKDWRKFRSYKDGAEYYGFSKRYFQTLAKDAKAIYKVNRRVLVNCEILEEYLETFHIV